MHALLVRAIERSISHNEIVTLRISADLMRETQRELAAACEGCADSGFVVEYWGQDETGLPWRVHLRALID